MEGLDKFSRTLRAIAADARAAMQSECDRSASQMVRLARALAPHRTGALAASIQAHSGPPPAHSQGKSLSGSGIGATVSFGSSDVRYGALVEFGTKPHEQPNNPYNRHHPGARANPFFWPAWRAERRRFTRRMGKAMRDAIRKQAMGQG